MVDKAGYEQAKTIFTLARKKEVLKHKKNVQPGILVLPESSEDTRTLRHHLGQMRGMDCRVGMQTHRPSWEMAREENLTRRRRSRGRVAGTGPR